jgi:diamine N-acetyltransferase
VAEDHETPRPVVNVEGELVALGPHRRDLLPAYQRWANDLAAMDRLGSNPRPMTMEAETNWFEGEATTTEWIPFTIYERATWRAIGTCALNQIDHRHGSAGITILIGEPDARGRGYGTEAVRLLLDFAFTALGLHNVMLSVAEFNRIGIRAYEKAGLKVCGRRRQCIVLGGRRWDEISMDCLASEFTSPVLGATFAPDQPRP